MKPALLAIVCVLLTSEARAADFADWAAFTEARRGECIGGWGDLDAPIELSAGKHSYRLEGHKLIELSKDKDKVLRIGVLSATKDDRPETLAMIAKAIKKFMKRKVDVIIANGDLASDEFQMEEVFPALAAEDVLVVAFIGNTESCGSFNRIADSVFAKRKNFINGNWVRRIELDDGTLLTLPGYHDRKFAHTTGAAIYGEDDMRVFEQIAKDAKEPRIITSHGPPRMKGKSALDVIYDGENVGSPLMTTLIQDNKIKFGLFGHILEAGGRGTDLSGKKKLPQRRWQKALYINAGTLNPDPWRLLSGGESTGMAVYVEVSGGRARYEVDKKFR